MRSSFGPKNLGFSCFNLMRLRWPVDELGAHNHSSPTCPIFLRYPEQAASNQHLYTKAH